MNHLFLALVVVVTFVVLMALRAPLRTQNAGRLLAGTWLCLVMWALLTAVTVPDAPSTLAFALLHHGLFVAFFVGVARIITATMAAVRQSRAAHELSDVNHPMNSK